MTNFNGYLLRPVQAASYLDCSLSTLYRDVRKGTVPPPITFGAYGVAWLTLELDSILCARICGYTDDELKFLVQEIIEQRQSFMEEANYDS